MSGRGGACAAGPVTEGWPQPLGLEGIEAIVFRTVGDQLSLFESVLPVQLLRLPEELARVDVLLDDEVFFEPFAPFFDPRVGLRRRWRPICG